MNFKHKRSVVFLLTIAIILGLIYTPTNLTAVSAANTENTITVRVDGEANQISGYYEDDTFWVADSDIVLLTGVKPEKYCKTIADKKYYDLCMYAYEGGYSYFSYDQVLNQAYMWSEDRYDGYAYEMACHVMNTMVMDMSDVYEKSSDGGNILTAREFMKMTDVCVKALDRERFEEWQGKYRSLRESNEKLTKADGAYILLYLAEFLGGDFCKMDMSYYYDLMNRDGETRDWAFNTKLFSDLDENDYHISTYGWPRGASAQFYTIGRYVDVDKKKVILDYDAKNNSFHEDEELSAKNGLDLLINNINANYKMMHYCIYGSNEDSIKCSFVSFDEEKCSTPSDVINENVVSLANAKADDGDDYDSGYILQVYDENPMSLYEIKEYTIRHIAEWGYKRIRLQIGYQHLFNEDLTQFCPENLNYLDQLIAYGMKYNVKIELNFMNQPGWWLHMDETFHYKGAVDIIRNQEHRDQAKLMWRVLAKRYQSVPNSALEFEMFWEYGNWLRTNAGDFVDEYPEYSQDEIVVALADLTSAVKEADPNRQMTMETTVELSQDPHVKTDNMATKYALENQIIPGGNYAAMWIYSSLDGTDDRVRAHYTQSWPYNYYEMQTWFVGTIKGKEKYAVPLKLTGDLVSGAELHLFIDTVCTAGTIHVFADGKEIHQEDINPAEDATATYEEGKYQYRQDRKLTVRNYVETTKDICFTLADSANEIEIYYEVKDENANSNVWWSGMKVELPKSYEQKKWIYITGYETTLTESPFYGMDYGFHQQDTSTIYIGNNQFSDEFSLKIALGEVEQIPQIPIKLDAKTLSFSTDSVSLKYDMEAVQNSIMKFKKNLPDNAKFIMRYEGPFDGTEAKDWNAYERDVLSTLQKNNFSWLSNDFGNVLISEASAEHSNLSGAELVPYYEYKGLNVELLKIHNQYRDKAGYKESNGHVWKLNDTSTVNGETTYNYCCDICSKEKMVKAVEKENHNFSKYVSNANGTHKVICADCGTVQSGHDKDACSGGTATCTAKAKCTKCKAEYGSLKSHTNTTTTTKATTSKDGSKVTKCSVCGKVASTTTIAMPNTFTLSKTSVEYTGSQIKPAVTVKDSKGNIIAATNYTVTYGTNTAVGKGTVKVTFKSTSNYSGSKELSFNIIPKKTTIGTPAIASDGITVKWTKNTSCAGYYIYRSVNGASYTKVKTITSNATVSWKDTTAKTNGNKYQYKIVAYKTVSGTTYTSAASANKTIYFLTRPTVTLANQASAIKVSWGKNAKATGYYVYKSTDGGKNYKKVKTVTSNATVSYTDTAAKTNGTKYMYKVEAYKAVSGTTYKSAVSAIKTMYFVSKPAISSLTNSAAGKILVKWARNAKATGYQIQYGVSSDFSGAKTVTATGTTSTLSKTIGSLTKGKTYYVRIRSYKTVGTTKFYSAWSDKKSVKIVK